MQYRGLATALRLADVEAAGKRQAQEVLVEPPRILRVATTIRIVVKSLDHCLSPFVAPHPARRHSLTNSLSLLASQPHEFLVLVGVDHVLVERLVHLRPALQPLHVAEPARYVRIRGKIAVDDLATEDHHRAEIVGNRDLVAAEET